MSSGCALLGDGRESADVGEEHRHLAALPAKPRELGIGDELLVDVLGDVLAEQLLHLPLLAPLEEVLIADAAEQRQRRRERRLRQVDPVAAGEQPRARPAQAGSTIAVAAAAHHAGRSVADQADQRAPRATTVAIRTLPRRRPHETVGEEIVGDRRVNLNAGHHPPANGVSKTSNKPAAVVPTNTILSLKTAGSMSASVPREAALPNRAGRKMNSVG